MVALPQRDVGEEQQGVEGMVELRQPVLHGTETPPAIDGEQDVLVALLAVFPADQ
jgi:hypothetical protein